MPRQPKAFQRLRRLALQVVGEVGHEQAKQEPFERRVVLLVPEQGPGHAPKRFGEVELFDKAPRRRRPVQVNVDARLAPGVEDRPQDREELRLVGLHDDGDHLPIEVYRRVVRLDERPELLDAVLRVKELAAIGEVRAKRLVRQPQFLQMDARPIGAEAAAVKADVEEPVGFV